MIDTIKIALAVATLLALWMLGASTPGAVEPGKLATAMADSRKANWGPEMHYQEYARLFVTNGRRWKVDPVIVACVAYAESRYHVQAARLYRKRCRTIRVGCPDRPGPCLWLPDDKRWKTTCKRVWINTAETGMMQVLYHGKNAYWGYKHCTGKTLTGTRRQKKALLKPPAVSICVGAYILGKLKKWASKRPWKMRPRSVKSKAFFATAVMRQHFWTAFYNWGTAGWATKAPFNGYPRVIAGCWRRYTNAMRRMP